MDFVKILNKYKIDFLLENEMYYIILKFNKIQNSFNDVLTQILINSSNKYTINLSKIDYYTIIKALLIYLKL